MIRGFMGTRKCYLKNKILGNICDACTQIHIVRTANGLHIGANQWVFNQKKKIHLPTSCTSNNSSSDVIQWTRQKQNVHLQDEHSSPGIHRDVVSWSKMITSHAKSGRIDIARQVFNDMPERNVVSWTAMIAGYVQNSRIEDARQLFDVMPERNVVSWTTMIAGYTQSGRVEDAYQLFEEMPERDVVSWNAMIAGYVQNGRIDDGHRLFDRMPHRDVVSWNTMISGYALNGKVDDARRLFDRMPERSVVSWTTMIGGYVREGRVEEARQLFGKMPKRNVISWNEMIAAYAQSGRMEEARHLFDQMPKRNLVSWTVMVSKYAQCGRIEDARKLFDKMPERNVVSWTAMVAGYAQNGRIEEARHLFDQMPERDVVSWTAIIAGYAQDGRVEDAHHMFNEMPERNVVSWNAIIAGYEQNGRAGEALELFAQMRQTDLNPNQSTFASILSACATLAALERGKQVHDQTIKMGYGSDLFVGNALISMYSKCGNVNEAHQKFDQMVDHDVVSWNAIIGGYAQHGNGKKVLELFQQMQRAGIKPDSITFVGVLSACSHAGLVDEGWHHFDSMTREWSLTPRSEHYACMVDLLGRSGYLDEAEDFVNNMPFEPDASMWGALLGACRVHGNLELGNRAAECLFRLEPQNAGTYVLMSHIYAAAGRWNDVAKVRMMMKDHRIKKPVGCSWIEVRNSVHVFVAGDRSHPLTEIIYATLEKLGRQMEDAGYKSKSNSVLHDMEQHKKQQILCHHSEKLAIGFGLISTVPGMPIRITKNLRVCGDCHIVIKFISKIVRREIVVRDANRFHHFKDGLCSCMDHW
eukprot:Gb_18207 [translate_table: standard]